MSATTGLQSGVESWSWNSVERRAWLGGMWKGGLLLLGGLVLGVLFGILIFYNSSAGSVLPDGSRALPPTVGAPSPDFSLPQLGESERRLSDLRGTPVVINFWATWCPPCIEEMPLLDHAAADYSGKMVVLGINSGESPELVQPFLEKNGITFPILLDQTESVTDLYFVRNFPMTFFIDADGVLRAQHIGVLREDQLSRYLTTIGIEP